jgi:hypothetical protein
MKINGQVDMKMNGITVWLSSVWATSALALFQILKCTGFKIVFGRGPGGQICMSQQQDLLSLFVSSFT